MPSSLEVLLRVAAAGARVLGEDIDEAGIRELVDAITSKENIANKYAERFSKLPVTEYRLRPIPDRGDVRNDEDEEQLWEADAQKRNSRVDTRDLKRMAPILYNHVSHLLNELPERLKTNLVLADIAHTGGDGSFVKACAALGMLGSKRDFIERGKEISNAVKLRAARFVGTGAENVKQSWFEEVAVLAGVNYPDDEAEKRTSDGLREVAPVDNTPDEPMASLYVESCSEQCFEHNGDASTLEQYVKSLDWQTGGSASMTGQQSLSVAADSWDKDETVRITKPVVPFVCKLDEVTAAVSKVKELNHVIVKTVIKLGETGDKERLIYPYPLSVAIAKMFVLSKLKGDGNYPVKGESGTKLNWSTSLGKSGTAETLRQLRTLALVAPGTAEKICEDNPWLVKLLAVVGDEFDMSELVVTGIRVTIAADAKGFDQQVGRFHADEFWSRVGKTAREEMSVALPDRQLLEMILPLDKVQQYIALQGRAMLESKAEFDRLVKAAASLLVKNLALLLSGTPETSKLGTSASWNWCNVCKKLLNTVAPGVVRMFETRGDDMIISLECLSRKAAMNLAYLWWLLLNAFLTCSKAKSRVTFGSNTHTEFLRIDYSDMGVRGYINRSIVWVGESRPLSDENAGIWAATAVAGIERALTVQRRGGSPNLVNLMVANAAAALGKLGVPIGYLHATKARGGAGVLRPSESSYNRKCGAVQAMSFGSRIDYAWTSAVVHEAYKSNAITIQEAQMIAQQKLESIVHAELPAKKRRALDGRPVKGESVEVPLMPQATVEAATQCVTGVGTFGFDKSFEARFNKAAQLAKVRQVSTSSLLSPQDKDVLRKVEKRHKFQRSVAVSWISAKIQANMSVLNPELVYLRDALVASLVVAGALRQCNTKSSGLAVAKLAYQLDEDLQQRLSYLYSF